MDWGSSGHPKDLLESLIGLLTATAWTLWRQWASVYADREERTVDEPRTINVLDAGTVAVLLPTSAMRERVRRALSGRARLCFASTWTQLHQVVARLPPAAVMADPAADPVGNPERQLADLAADRRIPIVLYTALTPRTAAVLLRLSQLGIHDVLFYRYDDNGERFVAAVQRGRRAPPPPLSAA